MASGPITSWQIGGETVTDFILGGSKITAMAPYSSTLAWKILQQMGISDCLTCLSKNPYVAQEATVRTGHGTTAWFQIGKGVGQGCILSPCLFNLYAEYIMQNARLDEAQASRLLGKIPITSDMQMTPS